MSTRERILEAAMDAFARFGYRRAAMDQVAEAAGLTRQAVYHHFRSKEALFRAAVEALHEGAYQEAEAAGVAAEQAGRSLADILALQIDAKFRYIIECLEETSQAEALLSERQHQTRDLNQSFVDQNIALQVGTIDRVLRAQGLKLRDGMRAIDLARSIQFAIRGYADLKLDVGALDDLGRVVRLIVQGAIAVTAATKTSAKSRPANRKRPGK
jgi:AcrR family transcriptional regulator